MHVYHDNQHQTLSMELNFQPDQTKHPTHELPIKIMYGKQLCQICIYYNHLCPLITINPAFSEIDNPTANKLTTPPYPKPHCKPKYQLQMHQIHIYHNHHCPQYV